MESSLNILFLHISTFWNSKKFKIPDTTGHHKCNMFFKFFSNSGGSKTIGISERLQRFFGREIILKRFQRFPERFQDFIGRIGGICRRPSLPQLSTVWVSNMLRPISKSKSHYSKTDENKLPELLNLFSINLQQK